MRRTITLKARPALKSKYHALLREDWGRQTAERVLDLLGELLRASGVRLVFPWEDSGKTARDRRGEVNLGADDFGELLELLERVRLPQLPPLPLAAEKLFVRPGGKLALAATRAWVYLIFQAVCEIRGEAGFFRDLQSLLYLNVVDWLLPELRSAGLAGEHDVLLGDWGITAPRFGPTSLPTNNTFWPSSPEPSETAGLRAGRCWTPSAWPTPGSTIT